MTAIAPMPHSVEAEQSVLGALLLDNMAMAKLPGLAPDHFSEPSYAAIFRTMRELISRGDPADEVTVAELGGFAVETLTALKFSVPSAANVARYARIVMERAAERRLQQVGGAVMELSVRPNLDAATKLRQAAELVAGVAEQLPAQATPMPFKVLPLSDLAKALPPAPAWCWDYYVPQGLLTVLSGHGGVGKSIVALMLAINVAIGRPMFGLPTSRCRVAFYSGEDGSDMLAHRVAWVCEQLGVDPAELDGWLHVLDATDADPTLFRDVQVGGQRIGAPTSMHADLRDYLEQRDIGLLVVDNMSDTFDGNEIERAKVRGFLRSLLHLRQDRKLTVVLLAHVDKSTARGLQAGSESYSGSTAVHNSARSRLFLARDKDGALSIQHQKWTMLAQPRPPLKLQWHDGQLPGPDEEPNGHFQALARSVELRSLLRLISEFEGRGEWISTALNSTTSAAKLLQGQQGYPSGRTPTQIQDMLRDAERDGLLRRLGYRTPERKERERWAVTDAGRLACR